MKNWTRRQWRQHKGFIVFVVLMLVFRSSFADWSDVPTGSMKPTILEGDRVFVNKMAYDIRVPFTHISLLKLADPARGDIVIFDSAVSEKRLVKRVIGLPGDRVALLNNELFINGQKQAAMYLETATYGDLRRIDMTGISHRIAVANAEKPWSSFPAVTVPAGHYLVLGDNRDNSADSRVIGFVPRKEIVGRSTHVVLSLDPENYFLPRTERFGARL